MKLHEIITQNENHTQSIDIALLMPYKKSLLAYYSDLFCCEPILMVTDVFNAVQYGKIVPSSEFDQAICDWLEIDFIEQDEKETNFDEDIFSNYETINFNSISLINF